MSKFGLNILAQYLHDGAALLDWVSTAKPDACVVMDSFAVAQGIRQRSPNTTVIYRAFNPNDHQMWKAASPGEWLAAHKPYALNGVVIQCLNEPTLDDAALSWLEQIVAQCPADMRLALPNFGVGNPYEKDIEAGRYDRLLRLVCGTRHILALHEYLVNDPIAEYPWLCGRFEYWLERAATLGLPKPRIIITEHGRDLGGGVNDGWKGQGWSEDDYYTRLLQARSLYQPHGIPVCVFGYGTGAGGDWESFNVEDAPTLLTYMANYQEQTPVSPTVNIPANPGASTAMVVDATAGLKHRADGNASAPVLRVLAYNAPVAAYLATQKTVGGVTWVFAKTADGELGWCALTYLLKTLLPFALKSPLPGGIITARFNEPRDYGKHEGTDWALSPQPCAIGTVNVLASADGVVESVRDYAALKATGNLLLGYGMYVRLKHVINEDVWKTWYGHLAAPRVCVGQVVKAGDPIGVIGSSGNSTGYHTHLTVQHIGQGLSGYVVDDVVNPEDYLTP